MKHFIVAGRKINTGAVGKFEFYAVSEEAVEAECLQEQIEVFDIEDVTRSEKAETPPINHEASNRELFNVALTVVDGILDGV